MEESISGSKVVLNMCVACGPNSNVKLDYWRKA